jgi:hypothetical protein
MLLGGSTDTVTNLSLHILTLQKGNAGFKCIKERINILKTIICCVSLKEAQLDSVLTVIFVVAVWRPILTSYSYSYMSLTANR